VGAVRIVLGGTLLALLALTMPRPPLTPWAGRWRWPVVIGAVGVAAYQPLFFTGVQRTGVAVGTLVALGSAPVLTGVVEWAVLRRRPARRWALATALAAGGVAVLALGASPSRVDAGGVLASVGAGASYAGYTLASKRLLDLHWEPERVVGSVFGAAAVVLLPVLLLTRTGWLWTPGGALTAGFLAVVPTAFAYVLFARGLRRLPAAETATLTLAEPVTAATLGLVLLGEPATAAFWAGSAVLLAGLLVLAVPGGRAPARPARARSAPARSARDARDEDVLRRRASGDVAHPGVDEPRP
jgi:DME family drug/metabolite transporter